MRSSKSIMTGVAVLAALALPMVAGAAGEKLIVKDAAGTTNKFVVTDTGKVGINVTTPSFQFHLVGNGVDNASAVGVFQNPGLPAASYASGDAPGFHFFRNNVSSINGGFPKANDVLGNLGFGSVISGNKWLGLISARAEADATTTSFPASLTFATASPNQLGSTEKMRITSAGRVGIGTNAPTSKLHVVGIVEYADNTAAKAGGLTVGAIYRTGEVLKIVY